VEKGIAGVKETRVTNRTVSHSVSLIHKSSLTPPVETIYQDLITQARNIGLTVPILPPGPRPNTEIRFTLFDAKSLPAAESPLRKEVWYRLMKDYPGTLRDDIQGMILHGVKLGYEMSGGLRHRSRRSEKNMPMDEDAKAHVDKEIRDRMDKGLVIRASGESHIITSPLGAVPKPAVDGVMKHRMIHNLSWPIFPNQGESVNSGICASAVNVKYFNLETTMQELGAAARRDPDNLEGRVLWKVDLKDAYRHVVVEQTDARLLGYFWPGCGFLYEAQLSFGGRSAPFLFNLVAEAFEWILRSLGVECNHYLDDTFGWVDKGIDPRQLLAFVTNVATSLGLSTAPHKTLCGPTLEILGITFDCAKAVAYIGKEKMAKIRRLLEVIGESASLLQLQTLAGSLVFVTRVCVLGRAFLRRIFDQVADCMATAIKRQRVSQDAKREIEWWKLTMDGHHAIRYLTDEPSFLPSLHVWSDASGRHGIGGHLEGSRAEDQFAERLPRKHLDKDIMFKEALAVLRCVELWKHKMHRKLVVFHVDNQALVAALNKGSCKQRTTQALVRRVYTLATWHSFSLRAVWLSSESNKRADDLSRFVHVQPDVANQTLYDYAHFDPDLGPNATGDYTNGDVPFSSRSAVDAQPSGAR
jgi:hypothetical protein